MLSISQTRKSFLGRAFLCLSVCLSVLCLPSAGATGPPLRLYLAAPPAAPPRPPSAVSLSHFPGDTLVPKRNQILCNPKNQV